MIRVAIVIALLTAGVARAQSTETLGRAERPLEFQMTAGMNAGQAFESYGGDLRAVSISIRHPIDGGLVGLRTAVWATDWRPRYASNLYTRDVVGDLRLAALMLMADRPIHLSHDFAIEPVAGAGVVPYERSTSSNSNPSGQGAHRSTPPYVLSAGITLRWRWLVVEQHAFVVTNDNNYFQDTLAPFTVGVRF